jgi:hypothetical protein
MIDAMISSAPGRELAALGRPGGLAAMLEASVPVRRREADGLRGPALPGLRRPGAAQTRQIAQPGTRDRGINHLDCLAVKMDEQGLSAEVDAIMLSRVSELPLADRMWEGTTPTNVDPNELLALTRAALGGMRAAVLRLAEEIEALKTER